MTLPEPLSPETITDETPAVPDAHSGHHTEERTAINALLERVGGQMAVETVATSRAYDPDTDLGRFLLAVDTVTLTLPTPNLGDYFYCFGVGLEGDSNDNVLLLVRDPTGDGYDTETTFAAVSRPVLVIGLDAIGTWMVVDLDRGSSGGGGGGSASVIIDQYETSDTWVMDPNAVLVLVEAIGAGGGGGSGRRGAAGTDRYGGGGGGAGGSGAVWFTADEILAVYPAADSTGVPVTVGAGGAGGAAVSTNNTDGTSGANGGPSSFGTLFKVGAGYGGGIGRSSGSIGGGRAVVGAIYDGGTAFTHARGASGSLTVLADCNGENGYAGAGGAGQGINTSNAFVVVVSAGGNGMGSTGGVALNITPPSDHAGMLGGGGGQGGWGSTGSTGPHPDGFDGASPGGGGGGGAAGVNDTSPSGKGGDGGDGRVRVTQFVIEASA